MEPYTTIRDDDLLGPCIGATVVDITQHEPEDFEERGEAFVCLHFSNGYTVQFPVGDEPFVISPPEGAPG